ncbi:MAG TPA: recombinase family protein [Steroidobacteraceae bacterium]|nr:recombinase family protein [Steroidobacteraceae bacterium]
MRVVTYARYSTDKQTEASIDDQNRVCAEYAQRQGWQIAEHYSDQGISGAALGNRPGVLRMQEAAFGRRFDVLLVTDLSRLSRSQGDLSKMIDRLVAKGVRVVGVQDGYDSARRGHKLQAGLSGIIGEAFREMVKDRTYAALESRAKDRRPTGGRAYGYRDGKIDETEARIVLEIFSRFADGASCRAIAAELNGRRIPSPGSTWKRTERRAQGWMGSGVRVILRNERYRGVVNWNTSEWRKDPDSGKRRRVERPRGAWISHADESLRIIPEELWARVQRRITAAPGDEKLRPGGWGERKTRAGEIVVSRKYLLSGLLRCDVCDAHYTIRDSRTYGCSSHFDGEACSNAVRVVRRHIEDVLLRGEESGLSGLLAPQRAALMAKEMQTYYVERLRAMQDRTAEVPRELAELSSRIGRLRERLRTGDPDMTADEIAAAIERAEMKRRELEEQQPTARASAKVFSVLPKAAELYRRQVLAGLDGNPREALKARVFLRDWFGGRIRLEPLAGGGLMAHWNQNGAALLRFERVVAGASLRPAYGPRPHPTLPLPQPPAGWAGARQPTPKTGPPSCYGRG